MRSNAVYSARRMTSSIMMVGGEQRAEDGEFTKSTWMWSNLAKIAKKPKLPWLLATTGTTQNSDPKHLAVAGSHNRDMSSRIKAMTTVRASSKIYRRDILRSKHIPLVASWKQIRSKSISENHRPLYALWWPET